MALSDETNLFLKLLWLQEYPKTTFFFLIAKIFYSKQMLCKHVEIECIFSDYFDSWKGFALFFLWLQVLIYSKKMHWKIAQRKHEAWHENEHDNALPNFATHQLKWFSK